MIFVFFFYGGERGKVLVFGRIYIDEIVCLERVRYSWEYVFSHYLAAISLTMEKKTDRRVDQQVIVTLKSYPNREVIFLLLIIRQNHATRKID